MHDQEMRNLARESESSRSRKRRRDSTTMQNDLSLSRKSISNNACGTIKHCEDNGSSAINGSDGVNAPCHSNCSSIQENSKDLGAPAATTESQHHASDRNLREIRKSFLNQIAEARQYPESDKYSTAPSSPTNHSIDHANLPQVPMSKTRKCSGYRPWLGTQELPIELTDKEYSIDTAAGEGGFLLQDMSEPGGMRMSCGESQESRDTCLTLSDSMFESQTHEDESSDERMKRLQRRREAYIDAKMLGKLKSWESALTSSGNQTKELEL